MKANSKFLRLLLVVFLMGQMLVHCVEDSIHEHKTTKCLKTTVVEECYQMEQMEPKECGNSTICQKQMRITSIKIEPYDSQFVSQLLKTCCGACAKVSTINMVDKVSDISMTTLNNSDVAFPVLGEEHDTEIHGYRFLPLVEADDTYYITLNTKNKLYPLITSAAGLWQLVVIIMLLVIVAGFVCWMMETWSNETEFPRSLHRGWFEGVWWSFVTVTTVGYGDKTPKSIHTKVFSMIWIMFGMAAFSLITAQLSYEITDVHAKSHPIMPGKRVATIRHRLYEQVIVARNGGTLVVTSSGNMTSSIYELIEMLEKDVVDGLLIDRYTLLTFLRVLPVTVPTSNDIIFFKEHIIQYKMMHKDRKLSYGILIKNHLHYQDLKEVIKHHHLVLQVCQNLYLNTINRERHLGEKDSTVFTASYHIFWYTTVTVAIAISIVGCLGGVHYVWRYVWEVSNCDNCCQQQTEITTEFQPPVSTEFFV